MWASLGSAHQYCANWGVICWRVSHLAPPELANLEPSSPAATAILQAGGRRDASPAELVDLVRADAAFAARVLRLVNSGGSAATVEVSDLDRAANMLGVRGLANVALSFVVSDLTPSGEAGAAFLAQSLRRAAAARMLAERLAPGEDSECFTIGLLLEVGLAVGDKESNSLSFVSSPSAHRVVHERAMGRRPHPELGAALARAYHLPRTFVEAIGRHHDTTPPPAGPHAKVAWGAEKIAAMFEVGGLASGETELCDLAGALGVEAEFVKHIAELLPEETRKLASVFERDLGPQLSLAELRQQANERLVELNEQYAHTVMALRRVIAEKDALAERLGQLNRELEHLATTDPLTRLANRRLLEMVLQRDIAKCQRDKQPFTFVLLDVDHFKRFNDSYGHDLGDRVLQRVADVLVSSARRSDLVARFGGEEFAVLLPNTGQEGALQVAERMRSSIERGFIVHEGNRLQVTASFGVATREPHAGESASALLQRADAALYAAKHGGRNRVEAAREAVSEDA